MNSRNSQTAWWRSKATSGCVVCLSVLLPRFNCILSLCFRGNRSPFTAFKRWWKAALCTLDKKNTIAIVYSAQKDGDDALLKALVYVRLHKPGTVLFFSSYVAGNKTQVFRFAATAAYFGGWSECLKVQCESHCHSGGVCNYCRSHCFTLKGCIQAPELRLSSRLNAMKNRKRACGYLGALILMISLITGHFLHTHTHTHLQRNCIHSRQSTGT